MKKQFRDFESAREFVQKIGLENQRKWGYYCQSGKKPDDIPASPQGIYKNEWKGYGDWLGTGVMAKKNKLFRPFKEAREFVRKLNLNTVEEWMTYCKSGDKPEDIPFSPRDLYKKEFEGYGDWLGTGNVANQKIKKQKIQSNVIQKSTSSSFRPYKEAQEFVQKLGLKSKKEWREYCKSGKKPNDIPAAPERPYKNEFKGLGDWLGTGVMAKKNKLFRPFKEAREFVQKLGLKNQKEWEEYCKSGNKPDDIPASPNYIYKNKGWKGNGDWLGTGVMANFNKQYHSFDEAKKFVQKLGLKSLKEWNEHYKSGKLPNNLPSKPGKYYKKEWISARDFLGTEMRSFSDARKFVRSLGLKGIQEWLDYCKSGNKPDDIPNGPLQFYKKNSKEFFDWPEHEWRSFTDTRKFVRSLKLKSQEEWGQYCASGNKPDDIPKTPSTVYDEWKGWGDFLGTGNIASQNRTYRPFAEAREFVRKLKLKGIQEWLDYCKSGNKPEDIPATPWNVYKEWKKK